MARSSAAVRRGAPAAPSADAPPPRDDPPVRDTPPPRDDPVVPALRDLADQARAPLTASMGFLLRLAQQRVFEEFHRRLEGEGMTPARFSVLRVVQTHPGVRQVAVAQALQIKEPNLAVLLTAMASDGLLERRTDRSNRRANGLHLTPAGQARLTQVLPRVLAFERHLTRDLAPGQEAALLDALHRIIAA